ncbi:MAG: PDDEXK nuclease domain-containing protein [Tannerella sp.]|jgi:predicted nuclease of restriction endonuclease-like (RecB) superfamily|nr:PDDEXK nuclease domain-containing protein [Tannerella sp.]
MNLVKQQNFDQLINNVYQAHCALQENAVKIINQNLTIRNWLVGCYIVEYEQNGEDRAKYGAKLLEEMAKSLKSKGLKGLRSRELNTCRKFYITYPQIWRTVTAKLQANENERFALISVNSKEILRTPSAEFEKEMDIAPELLLSRLSYSHFIELLSIEDSLERLFYEVESIKNNWSVRELERAIGTSLFVRTGLSKNKQAVIAKMKNLKPENTVDVIRNPYILEFLGLEEKPEYTESDLEEAILTHLQKFLIELGTGFCFEARQKRIMFDNTSYRIDLVFYHRILKSHVLIDLKIGKFTHADAGQMNVYLNYYKDNEMSEGDNPPIGIILCGDKNDTLVKYATSGMDDQMFVSKYLVKLPEKKILEEFIRKELER